MAEKYKNLIKSIVCVAFCLLITKTLGYLCGPYSKNTYVNGCAGELMLTALSLFSLLVLKKKDVLKFKTEGFKEGILTGSILFVLAACVVMTVIYQGMTVTASSFEIVVFVIHMLLIGVAEEVLFRGIIQNSIMECIGTNSIGKVRIGIVISSVIFASVHLFNAILPGVSNADALRQTVSVIPMGILFGAIYYRSKKNIWPAVLLHAINDLYTFILVGYISNASLGESISSASNNVVGTVVVFAIIDFWVLRKKKVEID